MNPDVDNSGKNPVVPATGTKVVDKVTPADSSKSQGSKVDKVPSDTPATTKKDTPNDKPEGGNTGNQQQPVPGVVPPDTPTNQNQPEKSNVWVYVSVLVACLTLLALVAVICWYMARRERVRR